MKKFIYYSFLIFTIAALSACSSDNEDSAAPEKRIEHELIQRILTCYPQDSTVEIGAVHYAGALIVDSLFYRNTIYYSNGESDTQDSLSVKTTEKHGDSVVYRTTLDPEIHQYLLRHYDTDGDGLLSAQEKIDVRQIDFSTESAALKEETQKTQSLAYLMYFAPNLDTLNVANSQIRMDLLNLEGLQQLKQVNLSDCPQISRLKVDAPHLTELRCEHSNLQSLDLSKLPGLKQLYCSHNQLQTLNVCQHLNVLDCSYNQLSYLDLSEYNMELDMELPHDTVCTIKRHTRYSQPFMQFVHNGEPFFEVYCYVYDFSDNLYKIVKLPYEGSWEFAKDGEKSEVQLYPWDNTSAKLTNFMPFLNCGFQSRELTLRLDPQNYYSLPFWAKYHRGSYEYYEDYIITMDKRPYWNVVPVLE